MIRTGVVELSTIPATAYRQKLQSGGAGVTIYRFDHHVPAVATIDKRTGTPIMRGKVDEKLFPIAAFEEAIELTAGRPYGKKDAIRVTSTAHMAHVEDAPFVEEPECADVIAVVDGAEYAAVVKAYTNKKGELSYDLINKDFIRFALKSSIVTTMIEDHADEDAIIAHIAKSKLETLTGNHKLTDAQVELIVEMLDDVSPRYVFHELKEALRQMRQ